MKPPESLSNADTNRIDACFSQVFVQDRRFPASIFRWAAPYALFTEFEIGLTEIGGTLSTVARAYGDDTVFLSIDKSSDEQRESKHGLPWRFAFSTSELADGLAELATWGGDQTLLPISVLSDEYRWAGPSGRWGAYAIRPNECVLALPTKPDFDLNDMLTKQDVLGLIQQRMPDEVAARHIWKDVASAFS